MKDRRFDEARRAFGKAVRAVPRDALYWINLSTACARGGDVAGAVDAATRATELDDTLAVGWIILGNVLRSSHRYAEALAAYGRAEERGHMDPEVYVHHAGMLITRRHPMAAITKLMKATVIRPNFAVAHGLMAVAFRELGMMKEAVECLKTLQALAPDHLQGRVSECYEKRHVFDWADLDVDVQAITSLIEMAFEQRQQSATSFALMSLPIDPLVIRKAAIMDARLYATGVKPLPAVDATARRGLPMRVGYLSSDLREHPVGQLLVEVLEQRQRAGLEVWLYSHSPDDGSDLRRRMVATADHFVDLEGISDRDAAERIRSDGIDLMIDLQGHTKGQRLPILAHRPAPVQASYLGYAGTTGADYIDYLIGDPNVTPLELADQFVEKIAQLPMCFQPNGRWRPLPQPMTREQAGLPEGAFVMCSFNHTYKILPAAFDAWCEVMREVPHAVLWLKETNPQLHANAYREAARRGVDPKRVLFARNLSYADHFSRLALADVFVDTWPYNAHTTASDALWAGVPVITHYGNSYASRVAASVLNAVGLPELAFSNVGDYVLAIRTLAQDRALLDELRRHLQTVRMSTPLFDPGLRANELEALYRRMIERSRDGLAPDHLPA